MSPPPLRRVQLVSVFLVLLLLLLLLLLLFPEPKSPLFIWTDLSKQVDLAWDFFNEMKFKGGGEIPTFWGAVVMAGQSTPSEIRV